MAPHVNSIFPLCIVFSQMSQTFHVKVKGGTTHHFYEKTEYESSKEEKEKERN